MRENDFLRKQKKLRSKIILQKSTWIKGFQVNNWFIHSVQFLEIEEYMKEDWMDPTDV